MFLFYLLWTLSGIRKGIRPINTQLHLVVLTLLRINGLQSHKKGVLYMLCMYTLLWSNNILLLNLTPSLCWFQHSDNKNNNNNNCKTEQNHHHYHQLNAKSSFIIIDKWKLAEVAGEQEQSQISLHRNHAGESLCCISNSCPSGSRNMLRRIAHADLGNLGNQARLEQQERKAVLHLTSH